MVQRIEEKFHAIERSNEYRIAAGLHFTKACPAGLMTTKPIHNLLIRLLLMVPLLIEALFGARRATLLHKLSQLTNKHA
eukprot:4075537-Amphidinium_carterae.1